MTAARGLRVLIVDGHTLVAEAMAAALREEGLLPALADLTSRPRLVAGVEADPPDLVLLDLELGGAIGDGATLVRPFVRAGARVLVMSANGHLVQAGTAIEQGAVGHLTKAEPLQKIVDTVLAAARGDEVMPHDRRTAVLQGLSAARGRAAAGRDPFERLTRREQQVLRELGNGKSVGAIAEEWCVSTATVRTQVRGVLTKLGVGSQLEAVSLALRVGWLGDGRRDERRA